MKSTGLKAELYIEHFHYKICCYGCSSSIQKKSSDRNISSVSLQRDPKKEIISDEVLNQLTGFPGKISTQKNDT